MGSDDGGGEGGSEGEQRRVWVNFNALDAEGCWVSGGERAVCPYGTGSGFESELQRRTILVCHAPIVPFVSLLRDHFG